MFSSPDITRPRCMLPPSLRSRACGIRAASEPTQSRPRPPAGPSPRASLGPDRCPLSTPEAPSFLLEAFPEGTQERPSAGTVGMAPGSSQLWLSVNTSDPVQRGAIFGRVLLFTLEKCQHTRSDKYFSLCSEIISPGNLAIATLVDEFFKYQPWAMSDNVSPPKRGGEVGLLGGPERKTRVTRRVLLLHVVPAGCAETQR